MLLSFQLAANKTKNDLDFEWLLCLARTLQACRRLQVREQGEAFLAIRLIPDMTKRYSNVERLLFLTSELQASQHRQAHEVREALRPQAFRMRKTENRLAESDLPPFLIRP